MATQLHHSNHHAAAHRFDFQRKTPFQLQTLEYLYADDKNPTQSRLEDYASALGLTYEQVRSWYIGRRRRDKQNAERARGGNGSAGSMIRAKGKGNNAKRLSSVEPWEDRDSVRRPALVQDMLYSQDYILRKIFRKDGPPLGIEFDSLPSTAFQGRSDITDNRCSDTATQDEHSAPKRRKVSEAGVLDVPKQNQAQPPMKHGKGKGFMSVWHLENSNGVKSNHSFPAKARAFKKRKELSSKSDSPAKRHGMGKGLMMGRQSLVLDAGDTREKRQQRRKPIAQRRKSSNIVLNKKKPPVRQRKPSCKKSQKAHRDICKLGLGAESCEEHSSSFSELADDEELELRELQAGPNSLACSSHLSTGGSHGCSLCKGLLPKFPPNSVSMRKALPGHPWCSSLKLENKLFKVFHFLYTYAGTLDLCPFTFDELAIAFVEKESLLLGKLHICLLQLLLSDVDKELSGDLSIHSNKNGMFLKLLNMAENRKPIVNYWKRFLNALTWTEIFRQVMVAAGFGSNDGMQKKGRSNKGAEHMIKYGLRPGSLKGELFKILSEKGNTGMNIIELAKSSQIVDLGLGKIGSELEDSICSTLAGDITLFEKISSSTYRLRPSLIRKEDEDAQSDIEGCGSIDDEGRECSVLSRNNSECDSGNPTSRCDVVHCSGGDNQLNFYTEIDESHQGESWLLGLLEGEYSDLSIDEKLNALLALIDLLSAGSSIKKNDPSVLLVDSVPKVYQHGSGGKIKRSTLREPSFLVTSFGNICGAKNGYQSLDVCPVDSSVTLPVLRAKESSSGQEKTCQHPMQSIFLGFDRRYNRYWLFLGPCEADDPGHTRVYIESSEDGHWQVMDSEEALCGFVGTLNSDGRREAALLASLEKRMASILEEMSSRVVVQADTGHPTFGISEVDRVNEDSPSAVSDIDNSLSFVETPHHASSSSDNAVIDVNKKAEQQKQTYACLQANDQWIWSSFYSGLHSVKEGKQSYAESLTRCRGCHDLYWRDEKHCKNCHTTFELDFDLEENYAVHVALCPGPDDADMCPMHKVLPSGLQALKAAVHAIELLMPENALIGAWKKSAHNLWVRRLRRTSSLHELLQVLADFVGAMDVNWLSQCNALDDDSRHEHIVACFQNMPTTLSAVALWLVNLDCRIAPYLNQVVEV